MLWSHGCCQFHEERLIELFECAGSWCQHFHTAGKGDMNSRGLSLSLVILTHSLVTDCPTQWGSKEKMVLRVNTSSVHVLMSAGKQPDLQNKVRRSIIP